MVKPHQKTFGIIQALLGALTNKYISIISMHVWMNGYMNGCVYMYNYGCNDRWYGLRIDIHAYPWM